MRPGNAIPGGAVSSNVMSVRIIVLGVMATALFAQKIPPANFAGTVHGISKKHLVLETAEGNLVDFDINGKTRVIRGKKKIEPEDLQTGDAVTIEAQQEPSRYQTYLLALTITESDKPKD